MSVNELKTLTKIIKTGWKNLALALADQADGDELVAKYRELLEELEAIEGAE
jgi:hypothetical protein